MFNELLKLIKLLFNSKPSEKLGLELEVITMKHFPFKDYSFMSWCGKIVTRAEKKDVIERFLTTKPGRISIIHEYGHMIQAESEHGDNWIRFYVSYFWHWFKHCPWMAPSSSCYYLNRYECEAYAKEEHPEYWISYNRKNLRDIYTIPNAKKKWKELGGTSVKWKEYLKSL